MNDKEKAALGAIIKLCGLAVMLSGVVMLASYAGTPNLFMNFMSVSLICVGWFLFKIFKIEDED
ncbi:MAG: hypothetical protein AB9844_00550 [Clostridiaceae bacterium]